MPSDPLQKLRDLDRASPHFHEQLIDFLRGDEYQKVLSKLRDADVRWFIEYLDSASPQLPFSSSRLTLTQVLFDVSDRTSILFRRSLQELRNICGVKETLPMSCGLQESLLGCVYEGTFDSTKVRIRRVKMYPGGDPQKIKEVCALYQVSLCSETHESHRYSIKWLQCRDI